MKDGHSVSKNTVQSVSNDTALSGFLSNVSAFKEQRKRIEAELESTHRKIRELKAEAMQLRHAPVAREDFIAAMQAHVASLATAGRSRVAAALAGKESRAFGSRVPVIPEGFLTPDHLQDVRAGLADFGPATLAVMIGADPGAQPTRGLPLIDHAVLCMLFEDTIKAKVKANIEAADWPHGQPLTLIQRRARMVIIDTEVSTLEEQADKLANALADAIGG
jgi:hypothetical protein